MAYLFQISALLFYIIFYKKSGDVLNPPGLMVSSWLFTCGFSMLNLGAFQTPWGSETYVVVSVTAGIMIVVSLFLVKWKSARTAMTQIYRGEIIREKSFQPDCYRNIWLLITLLCLLAVAVEIHEQGIGLFNILTSDFVGRKSRYIMASSVAVEYMVNFLPYCGIFTLYSFLVYKHQRRKWSLLWLGIVLGGGCVYLLLLRSSRGHFLILLLGCIYVWHRYRGISLRQFGIFLLIISVFFGIFAILRFGDEQASEAVFSGEINNPAFNAFYNYVAYCYQNLDSLIQDPPPSTNGKYMFSNFFQAMGEDVESEIVNYSIRGFNAFPFIYGYYHDFGLPGVVVLAGLTTALICYLYNLSNRDNDYSLVLAFYMRGIYSIFFGNYILLFNGQILPIVFIFLTLKLTSRSAHRNCFARECGKAPGKILPPAAGVPNEQGEA